MPVWRFDPDRMDELVKGLRTTSAHVDDVARAVLAPPWPPSMDRELSVRFEHRRRDLANALQRSGRDLGTRAQVLAQRAAKLRGDEGSNKPKPLPVVKPKWTKAQIRMLKWKWRAWRLAKRLGIKIPSGLRLDRPWRGPATQKLIKRLQRYFGVPVTGTWNPMIRRLLMIRWPPVRYPGDGASRQQMACYLAGAGTRMGAPAELLVMMSLVESGLKNLGHGHADSVGFFQIRTGIHPVPAGFGAASGQLRGEAWWQNHPEAQLAWVKRAVEKTSGGSRGPTTTGAQALGNWAADIERPAAQYRGRYAERYDEARRLVKNCKLGAGGRPLHVAPGGALGNQRAVLLKARSYLGVREHGYNAGPQVSKWLRATGVAPGNPWCAAFTHWVVERTGHNMPGGGWAAVRTWVNAAQSRSAGLRFVSAADARPGDLVVFDWGGGSDFSGDGHIGVLASDVNGSFRTIEGNAPDSVARHSRTTQSNYTVKFIRVGG